MPTQIEQILAALGNLSATADAQIAYLAGLGIADCADELALELSDLIVEHKQPVGLSDRQFHAISRVTKTLDRMSGAQNSALWTVEALRHSEEWAEIRRLALQALNSFK